jgi:hypothetical protein
MEQRAMVIFQDPRRKTIWGLFDRNLREFAV